jgi:hypothetical protein
MDFARWYEKQVESDVRGLIHAHDQAYCELVCVTVAQKVQSYQSNFQKP